MRKPIGLTHAHMECRSLKETIPVMTDLLAFEKVVDGQSQTTLKHPNTDWLLVVHEAGPGAPQKEMHNHYGVRVLTKIEVDAAYEHLTAHKDQYDLEQIGKPAFAHGSYSFYFLEPGTNGWEIECYEDVLRKEREWNRLGGVRAPHWEDPLPPGRFPGRRYLPQGFTHGTLACGDIAASGRFYQEVLSLEVHQPYGHVRYIKHPKTKSYIVSAVRKEWKSHSPNFRFTLTLESDHAVVEKHRWLSECREELGGTELRDIETGGGVSSFLLRDPDRNWWEISSPQRT